MSSKFRTEKKRVCVSIVSVFIPSSCRWRTELNWYASHFHFLVAWMVNLCEGFLSSTAEKRRRKMTRTVAVVKGRCRGHRFKEGKQAISGWWIPVKVCDGWVMRGLAARQRNCPVFIRETNIFHPCKNAGPTSPATSSFRNVSAFLAVRIFNQRDEKIKLFLI